MNSTNGAFPNEAFCASNMGLTKREYFAGLALVGIRSSLMTAFSNKENREIFTSEAVARMALADAAALLAELSKL